MTRPSMRYGQYKPEQVERAAQEWILRVLRHKPTHDTDPGAAHVFYELLDTLIWKLTEKGPANHKYLNCARWTDGAITEFERDGLVKKLHFEHCVPRLEIAGKLVAALDDEKVQAICAETATCVVLRCEHKRISAAKAPWPENYRKANVPAPRERYDARNALQQMKVQRRKKKIAKS